MVVTSRLTRFVPGRLRRWTRRRLVDLSPDLRFGPTFLAWRQFLARAQWWDAARIRRWQSRRLKRLVEFAYRRSSGYRQLYREAGVHPRDVRGVDDLSNLPFVTKALLRDNLEAFSTGGGARRYVTTGGSTGIPFGFYEREANREIEAAFMEMGWMRVGWHPDQPTAILRGEFIGEEDAVWTYRESEHKLLLSSYHLQPRHAEQFTAALRRHPVTVLQAYPSSLELMGKMLEDAGSVFEPTFDLVLLGSEMLHDDQLRRFQRWLPRTRFFCWYGHAEKVILAPWCEYQNAYHLWPFYGITEVIRADGSVASQDQQGEMVGTGFHMLETPFIRYRTMDEAVVGPGRCRACGREFPMLQRIAGRRQDLLEGRTGRKVAIAAVNMHDALFDDLRQFQFQQRAPGQVVLKVVPRRGRLNAQQQARILRGLRAKLGRDFNLSLAETDKIERTPSGKVRFMDIDTTVSAREASR